VISYFLAALFIRYLLPVLPNREMKTVIYILLILKVFNRDLRIYFSLP